MNITETLIRSLGLDPAIIQGMIATFQAEWIGLKSAFNVGMLNFHQRLDAVEKGLERVENNQREILSLLKSQNKEHVNGHGEYTGLAITRCDDDHAGNG